MKKILIYGGIVLVVGGIGAFIPYYQSLVRAEYREKIQGIIEDLESEDMETVHSAVYKLEEEKLVQDKPNLVLRLADHFSGRTFPPGQDAVQANLAFWHLLLRSNIPGVEDLVTEPLARVRHAGLLMVSRTGNLDIFDSRQTEEHRTPMKEFLGETLAKNFFLPPVPGKDQNTALLWDRVNLEILGDRVRPALESLFFLTFKSRARARRFRNCLFGEVDEAGSLLECVSPTGRFTSLEEYLDASIDPGLGSSLVQDHWEFPVLRDNKYLIQLFDVVALVEAGRREYHEDLWEAPVQAYIEALIRKAPPGRENLIRGIIHLRRRDTEKALEHLTLFQEERARDPLLEARLVKPYFVLLGDYYLALAHLEAARLIADGLDFEATSRATNELQQTRLELRLVQFFAELRFEREFLDAVHNYFGPTRAERPLLLALHRVVWGTSAERSRAQERIQELITLNVELLHAEDRPWWRSVAAGQVPRTEFPVETLFRVGRVYEQKGDLERLDKTIHRMEFLIEDRSQQSFLFFLRALLENRRGHAHEALDVLKRLLEQPRLPSSMDRGLLVALERELETIVKGRERIQEHLALSEAIFRDFYVHREGVRPDVLLAASTALLQVQLEGPLLYTGPNWSPSHGQAEILREVLASFDKTRTLSYFLERRWLELRDSFIEFFYDYLKKGDLETALEQLELIARIQNDTVGEQTLDLKGLVYKKWAQRVGNQARTLEDLERAAELWARAATYYKRMYSLDPGNAALKREAILAFENAGDPTGIFGMTEAGIGQSSDREILLAVGKAHVQTGNYQAGYNILKQLREVLWTEDLPKGEPGAAMATPNAHFVRRAEEGIDSWLKFEDIVDSANGVGTGYLYLDATEQRLSWQAPGDDAPGEGVVVEQGDSVRLHSSNYQKSILLQVRSDSEQELIPGESGKWWVLIQRRDFPLEPADAYLWSALAQILKARLPIFERPSQALQFVNQQLEPGGDLAIQEEILDLLNHIVHEGYREPETRQAIQDRLGTRMANLAHRLRAETQLGRPGRDRHLEIVARRLRAIEKMLGRLDTPAGVLEVIQYPDRQLQSSLRGTYVELFREWLERQGVDALLALEQLEQRRLDSRAQKLLLTLSENYAYRSPTWQGSLYLRGFQLYRQSLELAEKNQVARRLGISRSKRSAQDIQLEALRVLERLIAAPGTLDSLRWTPRGLLLLGKVHRTNRQWKESHEAYDRLAELELGANARGLDAAALEEVQDLIRHAALARADMSFLQENYQRALTEYSHAAKVFVASPEVLWAHYQMGTCFLKQERYLDGLREFQKGRSLIQRFYPADGRMNPHWLTGRSVGQNFQHLLSTLDRDPGVVRGIPPGAAEAGAGAGGQPLRDFWVRLFDSKITLLSSKS